MTKRDTQEEANAFCKELAVLVRKYIPVFPVANLETKKAMVALGLDPKRLRVSRADADLLILMQDLTSLYSPYVWSEDHDPLRS